MKDFLLVISIGLWVILAVASPATSPDKSKGCPTLQQLLDEKAAQEKHDREDAAAARREKLKDAIRTIDKIFPNP